MGSGALGGRAAEQVVFGSQVTSGAGGDLQQVERLARAMVTQVGMSNLVGPISISEGGYTGPNYSEDLGTKIDDAIRSISDECYLNSLTILAQHRPCLDRLVEELMETETLPGDRLREIVAEYTAIPEKLAAV